MRPLNYGVDGVFEEEELRVPPEFETTSAEELAGFP
jgi:hypothetical protein